MRPINISYITYIPICDPYICMQPIYMLHSADEARRQGCKATVSFEQYRQQPAPAPHLARPEGLAALTHLC